MTLKEKNIKSQNTYLSKGGVLPNDNIHENHEVSSKSNLGDQSSTNLNLNDRVKLLTHGPNHAQSKAHSISDEQNLAPHQLNIKRKPSAKLLRKGLPQKFIASHIIHDEEYLLNQSTPTKT